MDLDKMLKDAMTTKQVEAKLNMKDGELLRWLSTHPTYSPPKFGSRYVWTPDCVAKVEAFMRDLKAGRICAACGQSIQSHDEAAGGDSGGPVE